MNVFRFLEDGHVVLALLTDEGSIYKLEQQDFMSFVQEARNKNMSPLQLAQQVIQQQEPIAASFEQLKLALPLQAQEIWAAGVTYERSRKARNYEVTKVAATASSFYDKVYEADRPEIFLKSTPLRTVGPGEELCIRSDSSWQVPEPELGLVLDSKGVIVGYTVGNDMSSRDIEGENPLYLPQAKMWRRSCSIGPTIRLAETVSNPYDFTITLQIYRNDELIVEDAVSTSQFKRKLEELVAYLIRDNDIFDGTVLLTGTGIVPPDKFTLQSGDRIDITISSIGKLSNTIR